MFWNKEPVKPEPSQQKKYTIDDFVDRTEPTLEELDRFGRLELEVRQLREQVSDLQSFKSKVADTEQWIENYFRKNIAQLSAAATLAFEERVQQAVKEAVSQVVEANNIATHEDLNTLGKAVYKAVFQKLGRGL